jgi:hypothetical protein
MRTSKRCCFHIAQHENFTDEVFQGDENISWMERRSSHLRQLADMFDSQVKAGKEGTGSAIWRNSMRVRDAGQDAEEIVEDVVTDLVLGHPGIYSNLLELQHAIMYFITLRCHVTRAIAGLSS